MGDAIPPPESACAESHVFWITVKFADRALAPQGSCLPKSLALLVCCTPSLLHPKSLAAVSSWMSLSYPSVAVCPNRCESARGFLQTIETCSPSLCLPVPCPHASFSISLYEPLSLGPSLVVKRRRALSTLCTTRTVMGTWIRQARSVDSFPDFALPRSIYGCGSKSSTPSEHPNPTKIGSKMYPKMVPLGLTHRHMFSLQLSEHAPAFRYQLAILSKLHHPFGWRADTFSELLSG